jgi:hypothetical protein
MEHLIQTFGTLNLRQVSGMPNKTGMPTNQTNQLICLLVQENQYLKMEIQRLRSLIDVPKARIPNWVR